MRKKIIIPITIILLTALCVAGYFWLWTPAKVSAPALPATQEAKQEEPVQPTPTPTAVPEPAKQALDKKKFSIDDPSSIWIIVNKKRPIASNYSPQDLTNVGSTKMRSEAGNALKQLLSQAGNQNLPMQAISAYRSYATQKSTYDGYVQQDGTAKADTYSARPGHSEHQTGLAVDVGNGVCNLEICFGETPAGKWLVANAPVYGFIIRYEQNKSTITGYQYEPWHLRYVGKELAGELQKTGQTMEEYFGLPPAPTY